MHGRPISMNPMSTTASDQDGTFDMFVSVYDGTLEIQAQKDGMYSPVVDSSPLTYAGVEGVVLTLTEPQTARVSGIVVDARNRPVEDALVTLCSRAIPLESIQFSRTEETASDGTFVADKLLAGEYAVYLAAPDSVFRLLPEQSVAVLNLRAGEACDGLRFSLGTNLSISGRAVDSAGKGIEKVRVWAQRIDSVRGQSEGFARSAADGRFVVAGLEKAEYRVSVCGDGESMIRQVGTFPAGAKDLEIVLEGPGRVEGRVINADTGEALTQFRIYVIEGRGGQVVPHYFYPSYGGSLTYEPNGRFVRACPRGHQTDGQIALVAASPGFAPGCQAVQIPESGVATGVELRLEPSRRIEGRVVDTSGQPVPGAKISWGDVPQAGQHVTHGSTIGSGGVLRGEQHPRRSGLPVGLLPTLSAQRRMHRLQRDHHTGGRRDAGGPYSRQRQLAPQCPVCCRRVSGAARRCLLQILPRARREVPHRGPSSGGGRNHARSQR